MKTQLMIWMAIPLLMATCNHKQEQADAYGNFEAEEILLAAKGNGTLLSFQPEEGMKLEKGETVGVIDTTQLHLKKEQLMAGKESVKSEIRNIQAQIDVKEAKKQNLQEEIRRIKRLLEDGAATEQKLDDLTGRLQVINKQIQASRTQISTVRKKIHKIDKQIEQVQEQINDYILVNPVTGIVLETYVQNRELAHKGKNLYKIADISKMDLRVYISGAQLSGVKLGQKVHVRWDKNQKEYARKEGTVTWIANTAEFTPKVIQTKEARVNFVYAVKVRVPNKDGRIKIGMPGEVLF